MMSIGDFDKVVTVIEELYKPMVIKLTNELNDIAMRNAATQSSPYLKIRIDDCYYGIGRSHSRSRGAFSTSDYQCTPINPQFLEDALSRHHELLDLKRQREYCRHVLFSLSVSCCEKDPKVKCIDLLPTIINPEIDRTPVEHLLNETQLKQLDEVHTYLCCQKALTLF